MARNPGGTMHTMTNDDLPLSRFYRWERERAERIFLTQPFGGGKLREWTWRQVGAEVRRMAAYLNAQSWEPGTRVAILSRNCAWWIMADLAIWMAGHVSVPIYPSLTCRNVRHILEHSEAKGCFLGATDDKGMATCGLPSGVRAIGFPTAPAASYPVWDRLVAANAPVSGNPARAADDLATVIYTSGTTGAPKGVMHNFAAFSYFAKTATDLLGLGAEERLLSYLPLAHIIERCACEALGLFLAFHVYFGEGRETFLTDLKRASPTIFPSVPRLLLKFQQGVFERIPERRLDTLLRIPILNRAIKKRILRQLGLARVRYAASGGAALPIEILLWYRNLGLPLFEGYGMTETAITHLPPAPDRVRPGYVGSALDGVEAKLGEGGELLIKSPMNMLGYYKDPQLTREAFTPDGFFRTSDLVQLDGGGQVKIIGRLKEQFKTSKGKYVAPGPLETELMTHPALEACCVMGAGLPSPFAVVVLSLDARQQCAAPEAREALEQSLLERMNEVNAQVDPHERLSFIAIAEGPWTIENDIITPTLKIKRAVLESRYLAFAGSWQRRSTAVVWESEPPDRSRPGALQPSPTAS
jgi:long-chain acyl-CoA synthetase